MKGTELQNVSEKNPPDVSVVAPLTLTQPETRSDGEWLACAPREVSESFLDDLSSEALAALPYLFEMWALPHQVPPEGDWRTWVILGGRGAGKTRAGAEWVRAQVEGAGPLDAGRCRRVALVAETIDQAREVMVFGESGILACSPPDRRPEWQATRKRLVWRNGAEAAVFSASDPESLRGPQFDAAWVDELAKWRKAQDAWDMLQFTMRLGDRPRVVVTTTPQTKTLLKKILAAPSTMVTRAPTEANRAYLAQGFIEEVRARYRGSVHERQELDGVLLDAIEGALWTHKGLASHRVTEVPQFTRVVVAVDPPVSGHAGSDECGIVVVGVVTEGDPAEWRSVVLEDASVRSSSPSGWAKAALDAMARHGADRMVAEVNQGGNLVESVVRQLDPLVSFRAVRASVGKVSRAEPVAALYEQGRVAHVPGLDVLEDQMCQMTVKGFEGKGSPDRVDALVWALTEAMIEPATTYRGKPGIRSLL
jgi:phage terminase large subunit-like protein